MKEESKIERLAKELGNQKLHLRRKNYNQESAFVVCFVLQNLTEERIVADTFSVADTGAGRRPPASAEI